MKIKKNQETFLHTSSLREYIENEEIVVIREKISKSIAKTGREKFGGPINRKHLQTPAKLVGDKIESA